MDLTLATDGTVLTLAVDITPAIRAAADEELPPATRGKKSPCYPATGTNTSSPTAA